MLNGKRIRIRLIELDLHQKDLARTTGMTYDRLVKLMQGYRAARCDEVDRIAAALRLPTSEVEQDGPSVGGA